MQSNVGNNKLIQDKENETKAAGQCDIMILVRCITELLSKVGEDYLADVELRGHGQYKSDNPGVDFDTDEKVHQGCSKEEGILVRHDHSKQTDKNQGEETEETSQLKFEPDEALRVGWVQLSLGFLWNLLFGVLIFIIFDYFGLFICHFIC